MSSVNEPLPSGSPLLSPPAPTSGKLPTPSFRPFQDSFYQHSRWLEHLSRMHKILRDMDLTAFARAGGTALADLGVIDVVTWMGGSLDPLGRAIQTLLLEETGPEKTPTLKTRYEHLAYLLWEQTPLGVEPQMAVALLCQWAARDYFLDLPRATPG